jgi:hypothetical protein
MFLSIYCLSRKENNRHLSVFSNVQEQKYQGVTMAIMAVDVVKCCLQK